MREVIVSVRCDGAVARRSIAPSPDAVYGRGIFDEPQPLHCPSKVFAVVSTSDHSKETAKVRVVKRDCRVDVLENGEVVGTHEVTDKDCEFKVVMWKRKGMTSTRGFRIITALFTDPEGNTSWRTLPEKYWFEAIFEGLVPKPKVPRPPVEVVVALTPEDRARIREAFRASVCPPPELTARLRALLLNWQAGRIRPRSEDPRSQFVIDLCERRRNALLERCWQIVHTLGRKILRGEHIPKTQRAEVTECDSVETANHFVRLYRRASFRAWVLRAVELGKAEAKYWQPKWRTDVDLEEKGGSSGARNVLIDDKLRTSHSGRHLAAVVSRYESQFEGVVPNQGSVCTAKMAFDVPKAYRRQHKTPKVWGKVLGIDRANKSILRSILSVQDALCCARSFNAMLASKFSRPRQRKIWIRSAKKAERFVDATRRYIAAKFSSSFGSKRVQDGVVCYVQKDGVHRPKGCKLHYCVKGVVVGFDGETRATIVEFKSSGRPAVQERFHLPDPRVHFNREDAEMGLRSRRMKKEPSTEGARAAPVEAEGAKTSRKRRRIESDDDSAPSSDVELKDYDPDTVHPVEEPETANTGKMQRKVEAAKRALQRRRTDAEDGFSD